jgi:hypothetical protein
MAYTIDVNGVKRTIEVDGDMPLLWYCAMSLI